MRAIALKDILRLTAGRKSGDGSPIPKAFDAIGIDSRQARAGGLFFALRGGATDGHRYVADARRRGAVPVVETGFAGDGGPTLEVADTRVALQVLARFQRERHFVPAIAITGSNGKTTTKAYVAAMLGAVGKPQVAPQSYNNELGVALTLLGLDVHHSHLVCELGTNAPGEIDRLASWVRPEVGVITQIGPAHLQGLGDLAGVAAAKWELVRHLLPNGALVLPSHGHSPWLEPLRRGFQGRCLRFGLGRGADVAPEAYRVGGDDLLIRLRGWPLMRLPGKGHHDLLNALAAVAAGLALGLDPERIAEGLARVQLPAKRQQLRRVGDIEVLDDAYNANPVSMRALARRLAGWPPSTERSRVFVVIGEMAELGPQTAIWHREIGYIFGRCSEALGACLLVVGAQAEDLARGARGAGLTAPRLQVFGASEDCARWLRGALRPGDRLVMKASRTARLETLLEERPCRVPPRKSGPRRASHSSPRSTPTSTPPSSSRKSSVRSSRS